MGPFYPHVVADVVAGGGAGVVGSSTQGSGGSSGGGAIAMATMPGGGGAGVGGGGAGRSRAWKEFCVVKEYDSTVLQGRSRTLSQVEGMQQVPDLG